jgi:uncharacterized membrane protein YqgA involved in biofilm formation
VIGASLNAAGIIVGGLIRLIWRKPISPQTQAFFKLLLGLATVFLGLRLFFTNIGGSGFEVLKQLIIAALAILIGKPLGRLMHLQKGSNYLGQYARRLIEQAKPDDPLRTSKGLNVCAILFCAAPLGILGAVHDGLAGYYHLLLIKGVMDGLAMTGFVVMFGWGAMLSALPVFVFQMAITLACHLHLLPFLEQHDLASSVNAVGGLIVCTVSLVIFEFKKVELADFLPCLAVAPILTWLWK